MKTKTSTTENRDSARFAFMPEMVLNHLNEAKPTEITVENPNKPEVKIIITADPEIPNLDSIPISEIAIKKEIKPVKKVKGTSLETEKNIVTQFLNKIKIY